MRLASVLVAAGGGDGGRAADLGRQVSWNRRSRGFGGVGRGRVGRKSGAGNEARTRDLNLGKVALYQLSYSRLEGRSDIVGGRRPESRPRRPGARPGCGARSGCRKRPGRRARRQPLGRPGAGLDHRDEIGRPNAQDLGDLDEFEDIEPALARLELPDEGVRAPELGSQRSLGQLRSVPRPDEMGNERSMLRAAQLLHGVPPKWMHHS